MSVADRFLIKEKQLAKGVNGEVPLSIFFLIDDSRRQCLLAGLSLKYLLFNSTSGDETIDKALELC